MTTRGKKSVVFERLNFSNLLTVLLQSSNRESKHYLNYIIRDFRLSFNLFKSSYYLAKYESIIIAILIVKPYNNKSTTFFREIAFFAVLKLFPKVLRFL